MDGVRGADNSGTGTSAADRGTDKPSTGIADIDANVRVENLGTRTSDIDKADNLGTDADRRADGQTAASDKAHTSLFSLQKACFILTSSSKSKTVSASSFISSSSKINLMKRGAPSSKYLVAKI